MKCIGQGVLKFWCQALFDRFQGYVEIVRKSAITFLLGSIMTSEAQVTFKIIETTLLYQNFVCYW